MTHAYPLEPPPRRPAGASGGWVETAAWLVAFALLLAAPCAPEPPASPGAAAEAQRVSDRPAGRPPRP